MEPHLSLAAELLLLGVDPARGGLFPRRRRRFRRALAAANRLESGGTPRRRPDVQLIGSPAHLGEHTSTSQRIIPEVSEAVFGLIGVVIGGALNLVGLWVLDRRRDERGTRTAARLLIPDLQECQTALWIAQGQTQWQWLVVPDTRWKEQEDRLARGISNGDDWSAVMETFLSIERLSNEAEATDLPTALFTAEDLAFIRETHARIGETLDVLRRYAGLKERHINVKRRP